MSARARTCLLALGLLVAGLAQAALVVQVAAEVSTVTRTDGSSELDVRDSRSQPPATLRSESDPTESYWVKRTTKSRFPLVVVAIAAVVALRPLVVRRAPDHPAVRATSVARTATSSRGPPALAAV